MIVCFCVYHNHLSCLKGSKSYRSSLVVVVVDVVVVGGVVVVFVVVVVVVFNMVDQKCG